MIVSSGFTTGNVSRALEISARQIQYWDESKLTVRSMGLRPIPLTCNGDHAFFCYQARRIVTRWTWVRFAGDWRCAGEGQ